MRRGGEKKWWHSTYKGLFLQAPQGTCILELVLVPPSLDNLIPQLLPHIIDICFLSPSSISDVAPLRLAFVLLLCPFSCNVVYLVKIDPNSWFKQRNFIIKVTHKVQVTLNHWSKLESSIPLQWYCYPYKMLSYYRGKNSVSTN